MALRSDRNHVADDISFFATSVAERGGIVSVVTTGSGAAMDQSVQVAGYVANPSGVKPLGVLMNDVVNLDLTRQHSNWHKDEVQVNSKVTIWTVGTVVTNWIMPGQTPTAGQVAYVGHSGYFSNSNVANDAVDSTGATRKVGRFLSIKDEDGYAKIAVNLPNG